MNQKVLFIADWLQQLYPFCELCQHYGVSRKPHTSPLQTPYPGFSNCVSAGASSLGQRRYRRC
ncbi:MAG: hypothetical protein OET90_00650 [Desulfuromonadales bacterium]|nr:hypothetical protein [Desulfuromonadales bacterium]